MYNDDHVMKSRNYYLENLIADRVVRCFYSVLDENNLSVDFNEFLDELEREAIDWKGEHSTEVMFEVKNRYVLNEAYRRYNLGEQS